MKIEKKKRAGCNHVSMLAPYCWKYYT